MGKNYSNPQAAVDSMVYYCDGVFLSNYVSTTDYLSTASGCGKWDNRIKYRLDQGIVQLRRHYQSGEEVQQARLYDYRTAIARTFVLIHGVCHHGFKPVVLRRAV